MSSSADRVPFNDLGRMSADETAAIEAAIARVMASGWFVRGPEHDAFTHELAEYLGVGSAALVGNGTDALELALAALGVGVGDRVLTIANAGAYSTTAIRLLGATPVYADVDPDSLLLSPATLEAALERLGEAPKVLVVTHLFGQVADMAATLPIARAHGMRVLEDCAQSLGASVDGTKAGAFGDLATFSFYPTKNLGALGDGGAVAGSDADAVEEVRRMSQYGWVSKYHIGTEHGRNSRLDEMQAAILRARLPLLDAANDRRRQIHQRYEDATGAMVTRVASPYIAHLAVAAVDDRDAVRARFDELGVATDVHYPIADHRQGFPVIKPEVVDLPVTERAAGRILSVPMFPELRDDEIERVSAALATLETS
ncbi:MAG: DegT/DnrJ/EryC1/StrS family aminotransferase [Pseudolysinimonas sp.]